MRDFYEIVPLDKLISDIEFNISDIQSKENNHDKFQKELFALIKKETLLLKELKKSVEDMIEKCKKQTLLSDHDRTMYESISNGWLNKYAGRANYRK